MVLRRIFFMICCVSLWAVPSLIRAQNLLTVDPRATLTAYQCVFERESNQSVIRAALVGRDGLPLPPDAYTLSASVSGTDAPLPFSQLVLQTNVQRPPLQMILVLDTTNTVPIASLVNAVQSTLFPQLQVEDRVSLITFAETIAPRTQFYVDKNRLLNEHMIDLLPGEGDNRLYDAIYEAVTEFPINDNSRQVIVVLTDSNRRDIEQTTLGEIIERANRETVQVYSVGVNSGADQPDVLELEQLAAETGGYVWVYDNISITRDGIQQGVADALDDLIETLNSEVELGIRLDGLTPDVNGFITFDLQVTTRDEEILRDTIACPVEQLSHSIAFLDDVQGGTVKGAVDVAVSIESDLQPDETVVVFLLNNEIVQDTGSPIYRFNNPPLEPGYYTLGAQLLSRSGEILATTPFALEFYVQADVILDVSGGYSGSLEGQTRLEVSTAPGFDLPPVRFLVAPKDNPQDARPLTPDPVPFDPNGLSVVVIDDIRARIEGLFPDTDAEVFVVTAEVSSVNPSDPSPAVSNLLEVVIPKPAPPPPPVARQRWNFDGLYWAFLVSVILLNVLLFRAVGRARIRYRINHPDNIEMTAQLMDITVRREGVRQQHTLTKKTISIGRGNTNDINLGDDPNISRQHAVVMWRNGAWYFTNRKRRAISRVNGKRKIGYIWHELTPITEIEIGGALLVFHSHAQQDVNEFIKTNF